MLAPLQNRVAESSALVALAIGFPTGRGAFQDPVAEPCEGPLREAGWSSITLPKDGLTQTRNDGFRQFVIAFRVEGYHRIHGPDGLHLAQPSSTNEAGGLPKRDALTVIR